MNKRLHTIDLGGANCYLLKTEQGFVLFDTGGHMMMDKEFTNRRELLLEQLAQAGCTPGTLSLIILTHGDNDHTANAASLREHFGAKIAMHPGDLYLVQEPTIEQYMESFRYRSLLLRTVFRLMQKTIREVTTKTLEDFEPFSPDILLEDGQDLRAYGIPGCVVHLPGHTPGSIGILLEDGSLIAGDTFANMKKPTAAPNAVDDSLMQKSIVRAKSMPINMVYPGHGAPFKFSDLG